MTIKLIATLRAKEGFDIELESKLRKLVVATLQEDGCLEYRLHSDVSDKHQFIFIEEWESRESLDKHSNSKHFAELLDYAKDHLCDFNVVEIKHLL